MDTDRHQKTHLTSCGRRKLQISTVQSFKRRKTRKSPKKEIKKYQLFLLEPSVFHEKAKNRITPFLGEGHNKLHQKKTQLHFTKFGRENNSRFVSTLPKMSVSSISNGLQSSRPSFSGLAPLEAVLFDIDGTLCDSDPLHYHAFREMLQNIGFNGGVPITVEFFIENISGKHNEDICHILFPNWDIEKSLKFMDDKEVMFRRLAKEQLKPVNGLHKLCKWIEECGLKRAAVTNAPRANAELMISILGLTEFFQLLVVGSECEHAKPFPDPYLKAVQVLKASPEHTFVFEDSVSGIKAGVAAGMPVVGLTTQNPEDLLLGAGATFLIKDYEDQKLWVALEEQQKAEAAVSAL